MYTRNANTKSYFRHLNDRLGKGAKRAFVKKSHANSMSYRLSIVIYEYVGLLNDISVLGRIKIKFRKVSLQEKIT